MKYFLSKNNWWIYFILTYLLSWPIWILGDIVLPDDWQDLPLVIAAFGPMAAAMILIRNKEGKSGLKNWIRSRFNFRINILLYLSGAIILPFGLAAIHHLCYLVIGGQSGLEFGWHWLGYFLFLFPTTLLSGGNEEPGWRGYITPVLIKRFHPVLVCTIVGIGWATWYLPMYLIDNWGSGNQPFIWLIAYCIPLSVIMTWLYYRSKMSVIPVMLFHAGGNIVSQYFPMETDVFKSIQDDFTVLKTIIYATLAMIIIISTRGNLGAK